MMRLNTIDYIANWEKEHAEINRVHMCALADGNRIYNIEIRFSSSRYHKISEEAFTEVLNVTTRRSGGCLRISSTYQEARSGIISIKVASCNHGYNESKVARTLQVLIEEALPSFQ